MNFHKNVIWVVAAGAISVGGLQGQETSETPPEDISRAEVETFVYSMQDWTKEHKSEAELARMRAHREFVVSLLKERVKNFKYDERPKMLVERRPVENAIYWLGELGTDSEVPFLENLYYDRSHENRPKYVPHDVTHALIAIGTELSTKAIFRALDRMTRKYDRYAVLTALEDSSRSEVADQLMAIMAGDPDIGAQETAFASAVRVLTRVGRHEERDDLIRQALTHPDESRVLSAAAYAAEYGVVSCLPALRQLPAQRPGLEKETLTDLEESRRVLEAVASEYPNEAYLALLAEDLERYGQAYYRVMERLTPEPGVAEKLRKIYNDNQDESRYNTMLQWVQYQLLVNIHRLGGSLTDEERKRWPEIEQAAETAKGLDPVPGGDQGGNASDDPQRPRGDDDPTGQRPDNSPPPDRENKGE